MCLKIGIPKITIVLEKDDKGIHNSSELTWACMTAGVWGTSRASGPLISVSLIFRHGLNRLKLAASIGNLAGFLLKIYHRIYSY